LLIIQSRKYTYSAHKRDWNFLGDRGSGRPNNLKKCMKHYEFPVLKKIASVGEVWIFPGTTHCITMVTKCHENRIPFSDDKKEKP